jgi:hypothetical protein
MTERRLDYDGIKALAERLDRPLSTLIAQGSDTDPFYAGMPSRWERADWFKQVWDALAIKPGTHLRAVHYKLVKSGTVELPRIIGWIDAETGKRIETSVYTNSKNCAVFLNKAAVDARYLGLVPINHIVDHRNADTVVNHAPNEASSAYLGISDEAASESSLGSLDVSVPEFPDLPSLFITTPSIPQPYAIEIWIEKSTMDGVLEPLARLYDVNYTSGTGDISITRCHDLIERSRQHGKPVRVLTISDFDPGGANMPTSLARKLEFLIRSTAPDLDLQVRPIALLPEQIRKHRLPRNAIEESNRQAAEFERKYGAGATELDAMEPRDLRKIVEREIRRYHDADLNANIRAVRDEVQDELDEINASVEAEHEADIQRLRQEHERLAEEAEAFIDRVREQFETRFRGQFDDVADRTKSLFRGLTASLEARAPDPDAIDWPEPEPADEDDDPLFDSTRDYVEQIDRYKEHQQKPTERRARNGGAQPKD